MKNNSFFIKWKIVGVNYFGVGVLDKLKDLFSQLRHLRPGEFR